MDEPEAKIAAARAALLQWLNGSISASATDQVLADAAAAKLKDQHGYDLNTVWNPSAHSFDSRWTKENRTPEGLEKPFSAEERDGARLLACVGLLRHIALEKAAALRARTPGSSPVPPR